MCLVYTAILQAVYNMIVLVSYRSDQEEKGDGETGEK